MNVKRFTGRTSRDALNLVRQAFGDDAVVLSTKPCAEGVEVLAMAPDGMQQIERMSASAPTVRARAVEDAPARAARPPAAAPASPPAARAAAAEPVAAPARPSFAARAAQRAAELTGFAAPERVEPRFDAGEPLAAAPAEPVVEQDVKKLAMSTLSFQDYVRERMLKRRQAELEASRPEPEPVPTVVPLRAAAQARAEAARRPMPPVLREEVPTAAPTAAAPATPAKPPMPPMPAAAHDQIDMLDELRAMKGMIEQRFGALAYIEKLQRSPVQAQLTQKLLDCGFSPALVRRLTDGLPADVADGLPWAAQVLERNLIASEQEPAIEDVAGVFALIGSTGVGKTTTTAKIAAGFAARHGAGSLGLITLDAYRVAAHEQLRTYGRILGVPVHTAHDRASLEDLLDLLSGKKMVLIDTAGMAQRDSRTRELLEMLSHRSIQKLLVVNAAAQGETIEDVIVSWRGAACRGVVLSKIDEAVKLGPALDALIRHKLRLIGVANGQRVPEDWHRLSSQALVQRALRAQAGGAWQLDTQDMNLVLAGLATAPIPMPGPAGARMAAARS